MATHHEKELKLALGCEASDPHWNAVVKCLQEWRASGINCKEYDWDHKMFPHAYFCVRNLFAGYSNEEQLKRAKVFRDDVVRRLNDLYETRGRDWIFQRLPPSHPPAQSTHPQAPPNPLQVSRFPPPVQPDSPGNQSPPSTQPTHLRVNPPQTLSSDPRVRSNLALINSTPPAQPIQPPAHTSQFSAQANPNPRHTNRTQGKKTCWWPSRTWFIVPVIICVGIFSAFSDPSSTPRQPITYSCSPPSPENAYVQQAIAKELDLAQHVPSLASRIAAASTSSDAERILQAADNVNKSSVQVVESLSLYTRCMHDFSTGRNDLGAEAMSGPFPSFFSVWMTSLTRQLKGYLDVQMTEILTLRMLLPAMATTRAKDDSHEGSVLKLTNTLNHLHQAVKWTYISISQFQQRTDRMAVLIISEVHNVKLVHETLRVEAEEALKNWTRMLEKRDQFLFKGKMEERIINVQQPIKKGFLV
ncbi:MAG: hypothetical protein Q9166_007707 [cf. Caloplaca sp. 2 TL-2023]